MDEQPVWRRLFDAWEKEFGPRLEEYVQSDEFAERMAGIQQMTRRPDELEITAHTGSGIVMAMRPPLQLPLRLPFASMATIPIAPPTSAAIVATAFRTERITRCLTARSPTGQSCVSTVPSALR